MMKFPEYIFVEEISEIYIYWANFSEGKRMPKPIDKLNKEIDVYDSRIFYTGKLILSVSCVTLFMCLT